MREDNGMRPYSKTRISLSAGITIFTGGVLLLAGCTSLGGERNETKYYESPPISNEISGEAREHCLDKGFTLDEIAADADPCLLEYWDPIRLKRSERLMIDWYAENKHPLPCRLQGSDDAEPRICEMGYSAPPNLPDYEDPWWEEQAVRDPGRTTLPGTGDDVRTVRYVDPE